MDVAAGPRALIVQRDVTDAGPEADVSRNLRRATTSEPAGVEMRRVVLAVAMSVLVWAAGAAQGPPATPVNVDASGVAVRGYDPVAYFTDGKAVAGQSAFEFTWSGATWRFASAANREAFAKMPERYAPQFGGYCSWAVSRNYTATIDPQAFTIVDGKLYLNYSTDVQARWRTDRDANIAKGHQNWPALVAKAAPTPKKGGR